MEGSRPDGVRVGAAACVAALVLVKTVHALEPGVKAGVCRLDLGLHVAAGVHCCGSAGSERSVPVPAALVLLTCSAVCGPGKASEIAGSAEPVGAVECVGSFGSQRIGREFIGVEIEGCRLSTRSYYRFSPIRSTYNAID